MRLHEIYQTNITNKVVNDDEFDDEQDAIARHNIHNNKAEKDPDDVGHGHFSRVRNVNPHEVEKQTMVATSYTDPYHLYALSINNEKVFPDMKTNPYLPRITDITNITSTVGSKSKQQYKMERLTPAGEVPPQMILGAARVAFKKEAVDGWVNMYQSLKNNQTAVTNKVISELLTSRISRTLTEALRNGDITAIKDKSLLSAIAFIHELRDTARKQDPEVDFDVHNASNIMYRMTPVGAQIVLSDPLASWNLAGELNGIERQFVEYDNIDLF